MIRWPSVWPMGMARTPAEARDAKVWAWEGDPKSVEAYRAAGLHPVVLSATDIMPSLQTGMIDSYPTTPLLGLTLQWYRQTPNMVGMGMAPLVGGLVMTKSAWEKIPPAQRAKVQAEQQSAIDAATVMTPAPAPTPNPPESETVSRTSAGTTA